MSLLQKLPTRLAALWAIPLRAPLPPAKTKAGRDKGPKRTSDLSCEVVTGCALLKGQQDPSIKPDSDYPEWLWKLIESRPSASELQKVYEGDGLSMDHLQRLYRLKNRESINHSNNLTSKK